jgi:hypothetical protein
MKMMQSKQDGMSNFDAWNSSQVFLGKNLALSIGDLFFLQASMRALKKFENENNKKVVRDLVVLWQLKMFREDEFIDQKHHGMIEDIMAEYCERVSKESLGLLDAISADDSVIGSPFADPDGKGFEKYIGFIMNSKDVMKKPDWWRLISNRGEAN